MWLCIFKLIAWIILQLFKFTLSTEAYFCIAMHSHTHCYWWWATLTLKSLLQMNHLLLATRELTIMCTSGREMQQNSNAIQFIKWMKILISIQNYCVDVLFSTCGFAGCFDENLAQRHVISDCNSWTDAKSAHFYSLITFVVHLLFLKTQKKKHTNKLSLFHSLYFQYWIENSI